MKNMRSTLFSFRFKEIDLRNMDTWPQTIKNTMVLGSGLVAFVLFFFFFTLSQYSELSRTQQEEIQLKQSLLTQIPKVMELAAQKQQLRHLRTLIKQYSAFLPTTDQLGTLLDDLTQAATNTQLNLILLKPLTTLPGEFYAHTPIQVVLEGDYQQFGEFFNQLAKLPYFVYPQEFTLKLPSAAQATPGTLTLQMTIDMYTLMPKTTP